VQFVLTPGGEAMVMLANVAEKPAPVMPAGRRAAALGFVMV